VIGVAGSNGKTTTKDMIAAVLRQQFQVVSTEGNLNNHIGVPLTLLRLDRKTEMAVIELGTNHPGELGRLCAIARPTAGVITNIGHEHLEFFGSLDGVEQEESTLLDTLADTPRATAFINVDDERIVRHTPVKGRSVTYGFTAPADFRGTIVSRSPQGAAVMKIAGGTLQKPVQISLGIPGDHIAIDALAAAAVGLTYRVPAGKIRSALEEFRPASKRMEVFTLNGVTILNDAYNANPDSMLAALRTLSSISTKGKRIAVLGDMRELGDHAAEEHSRIGREISTLHIDYILTCGASAKNIAGAVTGTFAAHYEQKSILAEFLAELIGPGDIVLIKASRGMRFEDILTFIEERLKARMILDASTGEAQEDKGETPAQ
jgi:UDP-N-acetylmuramoyl-tripeptide--D-alanyl-D-alanine ligase